jgi:hypothetical protein
MALGAWQRNTKPLAPYSYRLTNNKTANTMRIETISIEM